MILDNLKKAGVQNTRKGERLTFDRLDPYAGAWLHAAGEYTDADGKTRRVAVSIGPEHGTVGPQQVKEAAKEAVQGVGFDMLIVCGFAFDPHVAEEVKRYGKLTVLPAKMNPDLAMGDELLKKTGAGNLFMVFGEPDVEIKKQKNGQIVAEIKGVDVYDPTTGQIRSASTDDIACWFIDTDYNGESFFVRHAYFTGAEEPYDKLKRALRADIDEAAWSSLYSTVSRPFDKPESGKIAVKVINHYGDEVLKVFSPPQEIHALRESFEKTLEAMDVTLVVLIDDLDRCLPETTISTLEAIRLFLFLKNTAFVIAADDAMIKHAVRRHFPDVTDDLVINYFDKLIQLPIRVPPLGTQEVRAYMMLLYVENSGLDEKVKERKSARASASSSDKHGRESGLTAPSCSRCTTNSTTSSSDNSIRRTGSRTS